MLKKTVLHLMMLVACVTATAQVTINTGSATNVYVAHTNSGVGRWITGLGGAESGSNAGSDLRFDNYNDTGTQISTVLTLQRSTGYVGIGVASPQVQLDVFSPASSGISWGASFVNPYTGNTTGQGSGIKLQMDRAAAWWGDKKWVGLAAVAEAAWSDKLGLAIYTQGNIGTDPGNQPTEKVRISGNGFVGIGTTNLFSPFTVEAGSAAGINRGLVINSAHAYGVGEGAAAGALVFSRNRTTDTGLINVSAQVVGGNESETTSDYGYLAFHTTDGASISQERLRINSAGNVGIGTTSPARKLDIVGDGQVSTNWIIGSGLYATHHYPAVGNTLYFRNGSGGEMMTISNGNVGIGTISPAAILHSKATGGPSVALMIETDQTEAYLSLKASGTSTLSSVRIGALGENLLFLNNGATERMRIDGSGKVGIGTTTPTHKLAVNGTIRAKEVIVDTGWADYVFADDYQLAPLSEVEEHIKTNKHLPGIPSAAEVAEGGVSLGDMQARMMAKIEELTLHQIAQEKRLTEQVGKLEEQATRVATLERQNAELRERLLAVTQNQ